MFSFSKEESLLSGDAHLHKLNFGDFVMMLPKTEVKLINTFLHLLAWHFWA